MVLNHRGPKRQWQTLAVLKKRSSHIHGDALWQKKKKKRKRSNLPRSASIG